MGNREEDILVNLRASSWVNWPKLKITGRKICSNYLIRVFFTRKPDFEVIFIGKQHSKRPNWCTAPFLKELGNIYRRSSNKIRSYRIFVKTNFVGVKACEKSPLFSKRESQPSICQLGKVGFLVPKAYQKPGFSIGRSGIDLHASRIVAVDFSLDFTPRKAVLRIFFRKAKTLLWISLSHF